MQRKIKATSKKDKSTFIFLSFIEYRRFSKKQKSLSGKANSLNLPFKLLSGEGGI